MKLATVQTILNNAQASECHGNIFTTSGHSVSFEFYSGPGYSDPDIIGYNTDTEVVSILSSAVSSYIDCQSITHIEVYPPKD